MHLCLSARYFEVEIVEFCIIQYPNLPMAALRHVLGRGNEENFKNGNNNEEIFGMFDSKNCRLV